MMQISLRRLDRSNPDDLKQWKQILDRADGATLFHDPEFLAYHGDRFSEHHLGCFKGEALMGVLPMALSESGQDTAARSPYGGSVGGWVFRETVDFATADAIAEAFVQYLGDQGIKHLTVTPPISCYYKNPSDTFLSCLLRRRLRFANSDVMSVVPLAADIENETFTSRARNMRRKAERAGVICRTRAPLEDFWPLMEMTFEGHGAKPTHTRDEWRWLMSHLPDRVWVDVAYINDQPAAGIGHFLLNEQVGSSFYLCQDPGAREAQALTALVCNAIVEAQRDGRDWFDFGGSTVNMVPRPNIFRFKESFGAIGVFRHTYELEVA